MKYSETLMQHFKNPHNQGQLKDADAVGEVGNIKCGDIMKIYIKVGEKDNQKIIKDIKFETLGCAAAIAASSALTDLAKGKSFEDALSLTKEEIVKELGGDIPAVKYHCSILAEEGLKKAIAQYKKNSY